MEVCYDHRNNQLEDPDKTGSTALMIVARIQDAPSQDTSLAIMELLLNHSANVDTTVAEAWGPHYKGPQCGTTPLFVVRG